MYGDWQEAICLFRNIGRGSMQIKDRRERLRDQLRAETLAAARDLIQECGYGGLTIRKLAERLKCSPMALYSYFPNKQALLVALAGEGFRKLAQRFEEAKPRDPLAFMRKVLWEYVAYAEENPIEYKILFLSVEATADANKTKRDLKEGNPAFRILFEAVMNCIDEGLFEGDAFAISTVLWTGVYGASAILITQRNFPFASRKRYIEELIAILLSGVQNHPVGPI
jgi:AcrR family transcriptional regulator